MVRAVLFDVNETLLSLDPVRRRMREVGLPDGSLERWFAAVLRDGLASAAADTWAGFGDLARHHAAGLVAEHGGPDDAVETVLGGFGELSVHPDVAPALRAARAAGVVTATLTNGTAAVTSAALERAGLRDRVDHVWDVEACGRWKPRPEPYRWAVEALGRHDPGEVALVAVHPWDVHGAQTAGLRGGLVVRTGPLEPHPSFAPPHVVGRSLDDVVERLLGT